MTRMVKINKMMIKIIINKKIWQASNIMMSRPKKISSKINKKKNNSWTNNKLKIKNKIKIKIKIKIKPRMKKVQESKRL